MYFIWKKQNKNTNHQTKVRGSFLQNIYMICFCFYIYSFLKLLIYIQALMIMNKYVSVYRFFKLTFFRETWQKKKKNSSTDGVSDLGSVACFTFNHICTHDKLFFVGTVLGYVKFLHMHLLIAQRTLFWYLSPCLVQFNLFGTSKLRCCCWVNHLPQSFLSPSLYQNNG